MRKTQPSDRPGTSDSSTSAGGRQPVDMHSSQAASASRPQTPPTQRNEAARAAASALLAQQLREFPEPPRQPRPDNAGSHFERRRERDQQHASTQPASQPQVRTKPAPRLGKFHEDLSALTVDNAESTPAATTAERKTNYKQALGDFFTDAETLKDIRARREMASKGLSVDTSSATLSSSAPSTQVGTPTSVRRDSGLGKIKNFFDPQPNYASSPAPTLQRINSGFSASIKKVFSRPSSSHSKAESNYGSVSGSRPASLLSPLTSAKDKWNDYQAIKDLKKQDREREEQLAIAAKEREGRNVTLALKRQQQADELREKLAKVKQAELEAKQRDIARAERRKAREAESAETDARLEGLRLGGGTPGDRTTRFSDFINAPASNESLEKIPGTSSNFLGPKIEEKGKQSSASNLLAWGKSAMHLGESKPKRRNSQDSDMSFADVGVTEMMEACKTCWEVPKGTGCLRNGLCKNCR